MKESNIEELIKESIKDEERILGLLEKNNYQELFNPNMISHLKGNIETLEKALKNYGKPFNISYKFK